VLQSYQNNPLRQIQAGIMGALLGDAMGVPHEFKQAAQLPASDSIDLVMSPDYQKSYKGIPYGCWSDDGSQLLCLLDSLICTKGSLSQADFSQRLIWWHRNALHQSGGEVFDCGFVTRKSIERLEQGILPSLSGETHFNSNGNGSLMRTLPVAMLRHAWGVTEADMLNAACAQSAVTHAHPISQVACAFYVKFANNLLGQNQDQIPVVFDKTISEIRDFFAGNKALVSAIETITAFRKNELPTGSGYVVDSLCSAIWALEHSDSYLGAVRLAISLGNDTDTTATICGGLAGLRFGLDDVPDSWWLELKIPRESRQVLLSLSSLCG